MTAGAQRGAAAQDAVAAHQVGAAEAAVAALARRAVPVRGRPEVDARRVRRGGRRPAGRAQPQREVEVLAVGEDPLVEPADLLPRRRAGRRPPCPPARPAPATARRPPPPGRPCNRGNGLSVRSMVRPIESIRSPSGPDAERRDRADRPGRASSGATTRSRKSGRQSTSLLSSTTTSPSPAATAALQASAKPRLVSIRRCVASRPVGGHALVGAVGRPVVADDQPVLARLSGEVPQAALA